MYKELEVPASSVEVRFDDLLDFPFGFADNVGWWSFVVWTVSLGLVVSRQKVHMEYRVDLHGWRKGQAVHHRGQLLIDEEWSVSTGR